MTAPDDTDERYSITIKGEIYLLVSQYTSNPPTSLGDDIEHLITLHTQKAVIAELKKVERLTRPMLPNSGDTIINIRMWASTRIEQLTNPTERSK